MNIPTERQQLLCPPLALSLSLSLFNTHIPNKVSESYLLALRSSVTFGSFWS